MAKILDESVVICEGEVVGTDVFGGVFDCMLAEVGDDCGGADDGDYEADVGSGEFRLALGLVKGGVEVRIYRRKR